MFPHGNIGGEKVNWGSNVGHNTPMIWPRIFSIQLISAFRSNVHSFTKEFLFQDIPHDLAFMPLFSNQHTGFQTSSSTYRGVLNFVFVYMTRRRTVRTWTILCVTVDCLDFCVLCATVSSTVCRRGAGAGSCSSLSLCSSPAALCTPSVVRPGAVTAPASINCKSENDRF